MNKSRNAGCSGSESEVRREHQCHHVEVFVEQCRFQREGPEQPLRAAVGAHHHRRSRQHRKWKRIMVIHHQAKG